MRFQNHSLIGHKAGERIHNIDFIQSKTPFIVDHFIIIIYNVFKCAFFISLEL